MILGVTGGDGEERKRRKCKVAKRREEKRRGIGSLLIMRMKGERRAG